jgi:uncharacterized coiled-coil protein SlyX
MKHIISLLSMAMLCTLATSAFGQDLAERLDSLEKAMNNQARTIEEQQKTINALKEELARQKTTVETQVARQTPAEPSARVEPSEGFGAGIASKVGGFFGGSALTNPYISAIVNTYGYSSNLNNEKLSLQGIPGFTTQGLSSQRGFNLDSVELMIFAPVDPYFNLYINTPITDSGINVEEAYAVTTFLPEGFQLKGGRFKSNFSRLDAQHPHAWDFTDIALPYRAFLGSEGLGGENGIQLTWLPPLPVYTLFGAEALQGNNDLLFGNNATSGPHAFTFFAKSSLDLTENSTLLFGPYVLFGQTRNTNIVPEGPVIGSSTLAGMEAVWKWKPSKSQGVTLQSEYLFLSQDGTIANLETGALDSLRRRQDGFYVQGLYQWDRWRFGARYGVLDLFADTFKQNGIQRDTGQQPWQITASAEFNPSEFSRIRLQYNHDRTGPNSSVNNAIFLQFLFGIGAHAAHTF